MTTANRPGRLTTKHLNDKPYKVWLVLQLFYCHDNQVLIAFDSFLIILLGNCVKNGQNYMSVVS
jgi:hypothetical protein